MDHFTLSLVVGAVAGALTVIPMFYQRAAAHAAIAAFLVCLFASVLTFYAKLPYLPWWADGMAIMLMLQLPTLFALAGKERKTIPLLLLNALLRGRTLSLSGVRGAERR